MEEKWNNNTRARYTYNGSLDDKNNPLVTFYIEKIYHLTYNYK